MSDVVKMWEAHPEFWKTESSFLSFVRGGIRRYLWSKNPVKLQFVKERTIKIPNTNPKSKKTHPTVNGGQCEDCKGLFKMTDLQTDHKTGEFALRKIEDIQKFVEGIVFVRKEDLALLCLDCHAVKTYVERYGVSKELAVAEKAAIKMEKEKSIVAFLEQNGIIPSKNAAGRRNQAVELLMIQESRNEKVD